VIMETYHYHAPAGSAATPLIYLATYGNFSADDEATCQALAAAGYDVLAMDPLRYLLHASARGRVTIPELWQDLQAFCSRLPAAPLLLGRPVSAGLALLWASGVEEVCGVLALGQTQRAFQPHHIFANDNPHTFFLARYVHKIAPRPAAFVLESEHPLGGNRDELSALHETCTGPRRLQEVDRASTEHLLELLSWLQNPTKSD